MKIKEKPRFLETITFFGDYILVPIKDIQFISIKYKEGGWIINIQGKNDCFQLEECFQNDEEKLTKRYDQIKSIIGAK